ncbi:hypothetical protein DFH28DRAFT_911286, partial [Melampsora americana]
QVVNKLLADDLELVRSKKRRKNTKKARGYFHEIFFTPDDWSSLEELTNELAPFLNLTKRMKGEGPTGCMVIPEFYALKVHLASRAAELSLAPPPTSDSVFSLFKAQEPEVELDEIAAYLKGTYPMSQTDNAREPTAVLPWWKVTADVCSSDRVRLVPRNIEYCVGARLWWRQGVPLGHKYSEANEAIEAFGGRIHKKNNNM